MAWQKRNGFIDLQPEEPVSAEPVEVDDNLGEGIEAEILRARRECRRLALMAHAFERAGRFDAAAGIHRILDAKRDNLRRLSVDNPDILAKAGDLVPRVAVLQYAATIRSLLDTLPARVISFVPDDQREALRDLITAEVTVIQRAAENIELDTLPSAA